MTFLKNAQLGPLMAISGVAVTKIKFNPFVTSERSKDYKRRFEAPSHIGGRALSSPLSEELRQRYNVQPMPIRKGGRVQVV
jgi:large subunit ribosomal protein L26e